ncbi:hypothetical protein K2173_003344 [Erythroxylum novogranatense]|uniref:Uncharacterized protein n=1 Tax=Erythroxylum novogranatense TaxID=1862640 RepID=A0AAV8S8H4_9ROSI|nr:hypothetical protein K2173_003344 [Erythroxylum novogranatense]
MSNRPSQSRPWYRSFSIPRLRTATRPPTPPPRQPQESPSQPTLPAVERPAASGVASALTSPATKSTAASASVPSSPARPFAVTQPSVSATVPSPPKPTIPSPPGVTSHPSSPAQNISSPVPTSPTPKPAPYSSVPSTPPAIKPVPPTSSKPTSPEFKPFTTATRAGSTAPSLREIKIVQSPPNSSKSKPQAPPPSPLALPPIHMRIDAEPQLRIPTLEVEKTVLVEKTIEKAKIKSESNLGLNPITHALKQKPFKGLEIERKGHPKKVSTDSKGAGMRVITIAGENQGATTEIFHLPKTLHKKGNSRSEENEWGNSSNEEKSHKIKDKKHNGTIKYKYAPPNAYINSNVQGINNSILIKSRCTYHDPENPSDIRFPVKDQANIGLFKVKRRDNEADLIKKTCIFI